MSVSLMVPFVMSAFVIASCQQPVENKREVYTDREHVPPENVERYLLDQCETFSENLLDENISLKDKVEMLEARLKRLEGCSRSKPIQEGVEEKGEEEEEEEESETGSEGMTTMSTPLRKKRGAGCEGGTLAAWACAPQCIFKLKGLCGLSLKSICHC